MRGDRIVEAAFLVQEPSTTFTIGCVDRCLIWALKLGHSPDWIATLRLYVELDWTPTKAMWTVLRNHHFEYVTPLLKQFDGVQVDWWYIVRRVAEKRHYDALRHVPAVYLDFLNARSLTYAAFTTIGGCVGLFCRWCAGKLGVVVLVSH